MPHPPFLDTRRSAIKILLTGVTGQVGGELLSSLAPIGEVMPASRRELDLAIPDEIRRVVRRTCPHVIVNAAAYTAVDRAEDEPELAMVINGVAPGVMAEEARRLDALLIHYSTDYVFDGSCHRPYVESDEPRPINAYGRSKLAGERAIRKVAGRHLILRTSWVFGTRGHNFLRTILKFAAEREELRVVDDQIGAPTWSWRIAQATARIVACADRMQGVDGVYHLSSTGQTPWFGFAQAILEEQSMLAGSRRRGACSTRPIPRLVPISTAEYPTRAQRPLYSVLSSQRAKEVFGIEIPSWRTETAMVCAKLAQEN